MSFSSQTVRTATPSAGLSTKAKLRGVLAFWRKIKITPNPSAVHKVPDRAGMQETRRAKIAPNTFCSCKRVQQSDRRAHGAAYSKSRALGTWLFAARNARQLGVHTAYKRSTPNSQSGLVCLRTCAPRARHRTGRWKRRSLLAEVGCLRRSCCSPGKP